LRPSAITVIGLREPVIANHRLNDGSVPRPEALLRQHGPSESERASTSTAGTQPDASRAPPRGSIASHRSIHFHYADIYGLPPH